MLEAPRLLTIIERLSNGDALVSAAVEVDGREAMSPSRQKRERIALTADHVRSTTTDCRQGPLSSDTPDRTPQPQFLPPPVALKLA